jgi:hypothetical protein
MQNQSFCGRQNAQPDRRGLLVSILRRSRIVSPGKNARGMMLDYKNHWRVLTS